MTRREKKDSAKYIWYPPFASLDILDESVRAKGDPINSMLTDELLQKPNYKDLQGAVIRQQIQTMVDHAGIWLNLYNPQHVRKNKNAVSIISSSVRHYNTVIDIINEKGDIQLPRSTLDDPIEIGGVPYTIFTMYDEICALYKNTFLVKLKLCKTKKTDCYAHLCRMLDEYLIDLMDMLIEMEKIFYNVADTLDVFRFRDIDLDMMGNQHEQDELIHSAHTLLTDKLTVVHEQLKECNDTDTSLLIRPPIDSVGTTSYMDPPRLSTANSPPTSKSLPTSPNYKLDIIDDRHSFSGGQKRITTRGQRFMSRKRRRRKNRRSMRFRKYIHI